MSDSDDNLENPVTIQPPKPKREYVRTPARDEAVKKMREARKKKLEEKNLNTPNINNPTEVSKQKIAESELKKIEEDKKRIYALAEQEKAKAKAEAEAEAKSEAETEAKSEAEAEAEAKTKAKEPKPKKIKKIIKYVSDDNDSDAEEIIIKKKSSKKKIIKYISDDEEEEEIKKTPTKRGRKPKTFKPPVTAGLLDDLGMGQPQKVVSKSPYGFTGLYGREIRVEAPKKLLLSRLRFL
jgi:membrane protein involved in colicin uptake